MAERRLGAAYVERAELCRGGARSLVVLQQPRPADRPSLSTRQPSVSKA